MSLSPKPTNSNPLRTWKDLDRRLQDAFKSPSKKGKHFTFVNPDRYEMSAQEICDEGIKNGYKVTVMKNGELKFE